MEPMAARFETFEEQRTTEAEHDVDTWSTKISIDDGSKKKAERPEQRWLAPKVMMFPGVATETDSSLVYQHYVDPRQFTQEYVSTIELGLKRYERQSQELVSQVLSDEIALFIAWKLFHSENMTIKIDDLDEHLRGAAGWVPFAKLAASGIVDLTGIYAYLTEKGERLVGALSKLPCDEGG